MTQPFPKFCPQCGIPLVAQQDVCPHCDARLVDRFPESGLAFSSLLPAEETDEAKEATAALMASLKSQRSRRSLFKGAAAVTAGATALGVGVFYAPALTRANALRTAGLASLSKPAQSQKPRRSMSRIQDSIVSILTVARTAEQLAVTFYSNGVDNAAKLGLQGDDLAYIKAALVEEQIHQQFFAANGGQSLATMFSFPKGAQTFTDLQTFIATQQQLEGVFDSAFLAAISEFAQLGRPDLAQIAGQVACIEAEHRALGRAIAKLGPADNWAFTPVLLGSVGDAPALVTKAGYLSPVSGNSYTYKEVSIDNPGVEQRKPFAVSPTVVGRG
ncbi:MAG: ferritin-like domain-containing protein [Chloroflexota bacterium]|nr:ferritin-like domain-containing protein [Chloroflexota bacterium]